MKKEIIIFVLLAMAASSFLNADNSTHANDQLASTKLRIENAGQAYEKAQQIKTIATNKAVVKPSEG